MAEFVEFRSTIFYEKKVMFTPDRTVWIRRKRSFREVIQEILKRFR